MSTVDGDSAATDPSVPQVRIVSVEHPGVVRDIDKGVESFGGEHHLQKVRVLSLAHGMSFF